MDHRPGQEVATTSGFARLVPLREARAALLAHCAEVRVTGTPVEPALGHVVAGPVTSPSDVPDRPIALREGFAVSAQDTFGASSYVPGFATGRLVELARGDALPAGTDAVLPLPAADPHKRPAEIYSAVAPFEGARKRGGDIAKGQLLLAGGEKLRAEHVALLHLAGITDIEVRVPLLVIVSTEASAEASVAAAYLAAVARREGATCRILEIPAERLADEPFAAADLLVILGDSKCGGSIARALGRSGRILAHGLAVQPGDTMGCAIFGNASRQGGVPVVFVSVRLETVLAAWLLLARPCLARLAASAPSDGGILLPLGRKIVSAPGMSELALLRRGGGSEPAQMWEPLATGDLPWSAIALAEAWLLVPPECEGYARGEPVLAHDLRA